MTGAVERARRRGAERRAGSALQAACRFVLPTAISNQGQHAWRFEHAPSRAENVTDILTLTGSARLRFEHVTPGPG